MAKRHSVVKDIKAKPNERGRKSHLPLECSCKKCTEDFFVSRPSYPTKRVCAAHFERPPQDSRATATYNLLKSLGLVR